MCREWGEECQGEAGTEPGKGTKSNKKGFHQYVSQKGKVKEGVLPLRNSVGEQVITDEEKAEELGEHSPSHCKQ